jgi:hypothetical protein
MPVPLEFDTSITGVDDLVSDLGEAQGAFAETGTTAEKVGSSSGGLGGMVGKLGGIGASALAMVNPVGLAVTAVGTLGPKLLDAGRAADAENAEVEQLMNTIRNSGAAYKGVTADIDAAVAAGQRKAFGDSDLRASLGQLTTDTGSVSEAIRLQSIAMDLAAQKGIPLAAATNLVGKADDESYAALAKLGIEIDKTATREEALTAIHTATAGAADIFASSTEGAAIRASASMDDALETIGGAVAPGIQAALGGVAEFLSSDTFSGAVEFVSGVLTEGLGAAFEFVQGLIGPLQEAVSPLIDAILNLGVGSQGTAGLMDGFREILSTVSSFIVSNVVPVVGQIAQFLADNLPAAIQFAGDAWTNVLQPAIANVWNFVSTVVFPLAAQLVGWLADNLPVAISALASFWTNTLQPALNTAWSFIQTNVIPILIQVRDWLAVNLPPAIQAVSDFFNNTLVPALTKVWEFIQDPLLPILGTLISEGLDMVKGAVEFLVTAWDTIRPAFETVTGFIADPLLPLLGRLISDGLDKVKAAAKVFADFWNGPLKGAINGVKDAIDNILGFIQDLINKLGEIDLPDFMQPGSPTPWEMGLRGIATAMADVSGNELPKLKREMDALNEPELGLGAAGKLGGKNTLGTPSAALTGTLTLVLQDERTIMRLDRQSEALGLQVRLETRDVV